MLAPGRNADARSDVELADPARTATTAQNTLAMLNFPSRIKASCSLVSVKRFIIENFIPLGFAGVVTIALPFPYPGIVVGSLQVGTISNIIGFLNVCLVFYISGLALKLEDLWAVLKFPAAIIYGVVGINFVTTLLAFVVLLLPFHPREFSIGLAIFCVVPTTLGVGVALTQAAKGNQLMSLLLTVSSNMIGIVSVPFLLQVYLSNSAVVKIDPLSLLENLVLSVLIPTIAGILCRRYSKTVLAFVTKRKTELSLFSTSNLLCIVWMALSSSSKLLLRQNAGTIFLVILASTLLHLVYLLINYIIAMKIFRMDIREAISVVIMTSQKSSPVALAVISYITNDPNQKGLFAVPCIIGQLMQIFIGSFVAKRFAKLVDAQADAAMRAANEAVGQPPPAVMTEEDNHSIGVSKMRDGDVSYCVTDTVIAALGGDQGNSDEHRPDPVGISISISGGSLAVADHTLSGSGGGIAIIPSVPSGNHSENGADNECDSDQHHASSVPVHPPEDSAV